MMTQQSFDDRMERQYRDDRDSAYLFVRRPPGGFRHHLRPSGIFIDDVRMR